MRRKKTWRDIETARQRRLWIREVIVPGAALVIGVMTNEELKNKVVDAAKKVVDTAKKAVEKVVGFFKGLFRKH